MSARLGKTPMSGPKSKGENKRGYLLLLVVDVVVVVVVPLSCVEALRMLVLDNTQGLKSAARLVLR